MVPKEAVAAIVPESWPNWGLGTKEEVAPRPPEANMLGANGVNRYVLTPGKPNENVGQACQPGLSRRAYSFFGPAARDGTPAGTGQPARGGWRQEPSPRLVTGASRGLKLPPAFGRG